MPTWVLWLLFLTTWNYSGVPMTPGFVGWMLFETRAECVEAAKTLIQPTVCMTPDMPDPRPFFYIFCFFLLLASLLMMLKTCKKDFKYVAVGEPKAWAACQKASSDGVRLNGC
jgi:hypothetical protein